MNPSLIKGKKKTKWFFESKRASSGMADTKKDRQQNLFITYKAIGAIVSLANLTDNNDNLEASIF